MVTNPESPMTDLIYIAIAAGFFAVAVYYARFCGNL